MKKFNCVLIGTLWLFSLAFPLCGRAQVKTYDIDTIRQRVSMSHYTALQKKYAECNAFTLVLDKRLSYCIASRDSLYQVASGHVIQYNDLSNRYNALVDYSVAIEMQLVKQKKSKWLVGGIVFGVTLPIALLLGWGLGR